jgi:hypothetical protein
MPPVIVMPPEPPMPPVITMPPTPPLTIIMPAAPDAPPAAMPATLRRAHRVAGHAVHAGAANVLACDAILHATAFARLDLVATHEHAATRAEQTHARDPEIDVHVAAFRITYLAEDPRSPCAQFVQSRAYSSNPSK